MVEKTNGISYDKTNDISYDKTNSISFRLPQEYEPSNIERSTPNVPKNWSRFEHNRTDGRCHC